MSVGRRRLRRLAPAVAAAAMLALPAPAGAHALLARAEPADGTRLDAGHRTVRLWFSEDISPRFRVARLVAPNGRDVPGVRTVGGGSADLVLQVPARLRRGTYAVVWRVLSESDGHSTKGTLVFGVGPGALSAGAHGTTSVAGPDALEAALRWLQFALAAVLVGGLAFVAAVLRPVRARLDAAVVERARRRVLAAATKAGALALLVQPAALARQAAGLASTEPGGSWAAALRDLLLSSRLGWLWLAQLAMLVLLRELAAGARTRQTMPAPEAILAVTAAVGLALVQALGSHAAAVRDAPLAVAYDTGHVLAAGVWVGAVAAFALAVWPVRGLARRDAAALARAARLPFAALAGVAVLVLCVTGLIAAGVQVASIDGLLTTFYGQTLLAKGGLVVVACALGAANFVLLGLLERGGRRRVVRGAIAAEAVAGLAILAGAAVLTASAPARGPQFASPRPVQAPTLSARAEDLVLTASVTPNRPGTNVFTVVAASSRRPPPAPIRSLALRVAGAPPVILRQVGEGRWLGTGTLASAGAARMTLAVDRGSSSVAPRLGWTVEPADAARAVVVSSRRLETIVRPAAILLLLGAGLAAGAVLTFERARRLPEAGGPEPVFSGVEEPT